MNETNKTTPRSGKSESKNSIPAVNRTMVVSLKSSSRVAVLGKGEGGETSRPTNRTTLRLSLETLRSKAAIFLKKEAERDYLGSKLAKYINIPVDNALPSDPVKLKIPEHRFEKMEIFAEGGQGIISAARENILGRIVALKTLRRGETEEDTNSKAKDFITEAKITAQLDHPSIIPIYSLDCDEKDGLQLSMKLISGKTLREYLKNTNLNYRMKGAGSFDETSALYKRIEIFLHVCDAIEYAHHRGIMHCDLKPENIMIGSFMEVYVMDWGLASYIPKETTEETCSSVAGTPRYLAPEVVRGQQRDARADIYTLGLILQEITTLRYAVAGDNPTEVMEHIRDNHLEPITHKFQCKIDRDLIAIIQKATEYDREKRYQSVKELSSDLRSYLRDEAVSACPDSRLMKILRWSSHHRALTLAGFFLCAVFALGMTVYSVYENLRQTKLLHERADAIGQAYGRCIKAVSILERDLMNQEKHLTSLSKIAGLLLSMKPGQYSGNMGMIMYKNNGQVDIPQNAVLSTYYRDKVSFQHTIAQAMPELSKQRSLELQKLLSPLGTEMNAALLDGAPPDSKNPENSLLTVGGLVKSMYVGLEEGFFMGYPWRDSFGGMYDPRKRPWYLHAKTSSGRPVWGEPYIGSDYQMGLCLPCSIPILNTQGKFCGVIGMDLTVNKMAYILRHTGNIGASVIESAIIDPTCRIIVSSRAKRTPTVTHTTETNEKIIYEFFSAFPYRKQIAQQESGILTERTPEGEFIYVFSKFRDLNWYFIQKINYSLYLEHFRMGILQQYDSLQRTGIGNRKNLIIAPGKSK